jgi:hypothetical protein
MENPEANTLSWALLWISVLERIGIGQQLMAKAFHLECQENVANVLGLDTM